MTASGASYGPPSFPNAYVGKIVQLEGTQMVLELRNSAGTAIDLAVDLQIDSTRSRLGDGPRIRGVAVSAAVSMSRPTPPSTTSRLLAGVRGDARAVSYDEHAARYGGLPLGSGGELVALVEAAGLRGRGGAAFPAATKLDAVRGSRQAAGRRRERRRGRAAVRQGQGAPRTRAPPRAGRRRRSRARGRREAGLRGDRDGRPAAGPARAGGASSRRRRSRRLAAARDGAGPLRRRRGDGARPVPERRPRSTDVHAAAAVRARRRRRADTRAERRDARAARADRTLRCRLVPPSGHAERAGHRARHRLRRRAPAPASTRSSSARRCSSWSTTPAVRRSTSRRSWSGASSAPGSRAA